jgi:16S rRNA (adenine1518-N6/adenine1519-N6)-dimethyltransferase
LPELPALAGKFHKLGFTLYATSGNAATIERSGMPVTYVAKVHENYHDNVMTLLESDAPISSITIMVQKEVAERMQEGPGTKDYGALSVAVTYRCDADLAFTVSPNCFVPKPNVDSAVIHLKVYEESPVKVYDEAMMFKIVKATFMQRRKTMVNSLTNAGFLNFSKEQILETLEEMGRRADVRGESFTVEDFALFTNLILKK